MIKTININVIEVIKHRNEEEQMRLIESVFYDLHEDNQNKVIKNVLEDFLQTEEEFDKRENVINALKTLIEIVK